MRRGLRLLLSSLDTVNDPPIRIPVAARSEARLPANLTAERLAQW